MPEQQLGVFVLFMGIVKIMQRIKCTYVSTCVREVIVTFEDPFLDLYQLIFIFKLSASILKILQNKCLSF
jgi:hypothetical protein